ncbi:MAG: hypothetical protein WDM96_13955 [Lacunisphaera sp.]
MIEWLGGGDPTGKFEAGIIALTPDGRAASRATSPCMARSRWWEFPVNVVKAADGSYTISGEVTIDYRSGS